MYWWYWKCDWMALNLGCLCATRLQKPAELKSRHKLWGLKPIWDLIHTVYIIFSQWPVPYGSSNYDGCVTSPVQIRLAQFGPYSVNQASEYSGFRQGDSWRELGSPNHLCYKDTCSFYVGLNLPTWLQGRWSGLGYYLRSLPRQHILLCHVNNRETHYWPQCNTLQPRKEINTIWIYYMDYIWRSLNIGFISPSLCYLFQDTACSFRRTHTSQLTLYLVGEITNRSKW